jgi:hypothetical protein
MKTGLMNDVHGELWGWSCACLDIAAEATAGRDVCMHMLYLCGEVLDVRMTQNHKGGRHWFFKSKNMHICSAHYGKLNVMLATG